jgi:hypothetical protein
MAHSSIPATPGAVAGEDLVFVFEDCGEYIGVRNYKNRSLWHF